MYTCIEPNCLIHFAEPKKYTERHGLDSEPYEEKYGCPICAGNYAIALTCDGCGKYIAGEYVKTESSERYCENCYVKYELGEEMV